MLRSIYDGDDCFTEISPTTFQYRVRLGLGLVLLHHLQLDFHGT